MLAIKNNIMASNAARHLGKSYDALATSVERLSSGLRINSAKDDAAGLAVRELVRADIAVLQQGSRNAQDGISMLQTMEGAMAVMDSNLIRMKELAEQAATGSYSTAQRSIMNAEFAEMSAEIDRIASSTEFNGNNLLDNIGEIDIHVGTTDTITITGADMTTDSLGVNAGAAGFELLSEHGVAATGDTWLSLTEANVGAQTVELKIQFNDTDGGGTEDMISFTLAAAQNTTTDYSLQDIIDAVNVVSQNLDNDAQGNSKAYAMASAFYDSGNNKQYLQIGSRLSTADAVTMTLSTGANTNTTGAFVVAIDQTDSDITEDNDWIGDSSTKMMEEQPGTGVNITTIEMAAAALVAITTAITTKDEARAAFGYKMNRLESTISILDIQAENLMVAESRISDVDVATEMATLTRTQVLSQAGISMLAQANAMPQMALSLLR